MGSSGLPSAAHTYQAIVSLLNNKKASLLDSLLLNGDFEPHWVLQTYNLVSYSKICLMCFIHGVVKGEMVGVLENELSETRSYTW